MRVSEKTTENFERLGRQARPGFEPGISRLPVLITEPLRLWRGVVWINEIYIDKLLHANHFAIS